MRPPRWHLAVLVAALAGLVLAGVSTYDFVQHLDRQVHSLHCSFIPGAGADAGASGCQAAMMSSYSSVFRTSIWGGIPISLAAMSVFAFILFFAVDLLLRRRINDVRATGFLALATLLPALASALMLTLSLTKLDAICKVCAGIYVASAVGLLGAVVQWRRAIALRQRKRRDSDDAELSSQVMVPPVTNAFLASAFGAGTLFVAAPIALYVAMAPDHSRFIGTCGALEKPDDVYGVMVPVQTGGTTPALEILDPLCPACKAFEQRLQSSGFAERLARKAILFPLDTSCNWMITENTHPGACTVSEAVLCAGDRAPEVIRWAFEAQEHVRTETARDAAAAERIVEQRFPELAACVGSPEARARLNKSLRWAVANNIRVLTPQLFVNDAKLCDEDVDIGLAYALARMLEGTNVRVIPTTAPIDHAPSLAAPPSRTPPPPTSSPTPPPMPAATTEPALPPATTPSPEPAVAPPVPAPADVSAPRDKAIEVPTETTPKPGPLGEPAGAATETTGGAS